MIPINTIRPFIALNVAVLTVSDTRNFQDDISGRTLVDRLESAGHRLAERAIAKDDIALIGTQVQNWVIRPNIDVIITTGGTGFTGRDVTPEAIEPLLEKKMDGFSTLFHQISYTKIGTSTLQSRAFAGLAGAKTATPTFIFCLPGSPNACKDAWDGILAMQLDYRHKPCNFVEIMPRLQEPLEQK